MFPIRYFAARYFAPRYYPKIGAAVSATTIGSMVVSVRGPTLVITVEPVV